ncbi:MAG: choice-of-anchor J domain-containing protein [Bacteroides acidifaciens]|uniref:DUF6359 domain-containing protein n=2 Tax=Bacteroides acidifaciens TaxID=85831 RepID=UPI0023C100F4|nr:DUF6359 domain-containing protein [Bacteroides acidifaciens]MDE6820523.1 choice-of-anchor J domain-containing protein [Bacteroides acidifaciens]MDE6987855.1 choice-of-anchor J domain-containing protein [Bacteroides acidifaciens]
MKKILNALFLTLLAVFTFSSCSDVPAPYDILGEGDAPGVVGDGTKENPYNIEAAQQKQDGSIAWVQGYIVGAIENVYDDKGEFAGNKASFTAPFNITSNVLIAESPDETNESKCLPVKIKNGSDLANALNLKDHPDNKGGLLLIQGELSKGFGKAALINTTAAVFNNQPIGEEQGGEEPEPEPIEGKLIFEEKFGDNIIGKDDDKPKINDYTGWNNQNLTFNAPTGDVRAIAHKTPESPSSGSMVNHVWFTKGSAVDFSISNINTSGYNKFIVAYEVAANVYNAGESADLAAIKVSLNNKEVTAESKVVTGDKKEGNIFYSMQVEVEVGGSEASTLKFTAAANDNTVGFRIYNVRLYSTAEGGGETPDNEDPFGLDVSNPKSTFEADFEEITDFNQNYSLEGWINKAIQASNVWQTGIYNTVDKYIKATPYNVTENVTMEAWFITPAFTVNSANKFTFDCAGANWKDDMTLKVFFLQKDANGSVIRNEITVNQIPTSGTNFEWVKDINVDLSIYNGKVGFVGFQYTVVSTGVNKSLPTYQIDNVKYVVGEGGGINPEPIDELLKNGSFEIWNDTKPEGWGRESATNATYSKYTENAQDGTTSVLISNTSTGNKRLGSDDVKLSAGNYTISVYAKNAVVGANANLKIGYVPIKEDGAVDSNKYNYVSGTTAITLTDDWTKYEYSIELETEQTVSIVFMSSGNKNVPAKDMLIDNVSLTAKK